jgi:hypothetical protein
MTAAEILREARALYAANPSHAPSEELPEAGCHCPITALVAVTNGMGVRHPAYLVLLDAALMPDSLADWNAEHSTEEVLAAFDRAVALAETR